MTTTRPRSGFTRVAAMLLWLPVIFFLVWIGLWIHFNSQPILICARGYKRTYFLEPLTQIEDKDWPGLWSDYDDYDELNWDGEMLHIDCPTSPSAKIMSIPAGKFVLAALPHGIGFGRQKSDPDFDGDVSTPWVIPYAVLALIPILWVCANWAWKKGHWKPGRCERCGYDLTGNTSGVCPECGTALKLQPPALKSEISNQQSNARGQ